MAGRRRRGGRSRRSRDGMAPACVWVVLGRVQSGCGRCCGTDPPIAGRGHDKEASERSPGHAATQCQCIYPDTAKPFLCRECPNPRRLVLSLLPVGPSARLRFSFHRAGPLEGGSKEEERKALWHWSSLVCCVVVICKASRCINNLPTHFAPPTWHHHTASTCRASPRYPC